jgi:hypothetical protein
MTTHLGLQRILLPSAQVSQLTTGSITLPSRGLLAVPDAPTIGTATASAGSASVTFTASATGTTATSFIATSSPSGITGTSATSPITVSGLSNGTAYTFTVAGINASGTGAPSAASNSVTPVAPAWEQIAMAENIGATTLTTFTSLSGYTTYRILGVSNTSAGGQDSIVYIRVNGSSSSIYSEIAFGASHNSNLADYGNATSSNMFRRGAASSENSNSNAPFVFTLYNADSTTSHKPLTIMSGYSSSGDMGPTFSNGMFGSTSAVTSITVGTGNGGGGNFGTHSKYVLYGIKEGASI